ncbi:MAG: hypothetical protein QXF12_00330 [Candidatus Aenigmatarchaeota archaeon]
MYQLKERNIDSFISFVLIESHKINHDEDSLSDILYLMTVDDKSYQDKKGDYYIFRPLSLIKKAYEVYINNGNIKDVKSLIKKAIKMLKGKKDMVCISFSDMSRMVRSKVNNSEDSDDYFLDHITFLNYLNSSDYSEDEQESISKKSWSGSDLAEYIKQSVISEKISDVSICKLADSFRRIVIPRIHDQSLINEVIKSCFDVVSKNLSEMSREQIEEFFLKRSVDYKYIALWARIRMAWISNIKKIQSKDKNKKRGRKKKK